MKNKLIIFLIFIIGLIITNPVYGSSERNLPDGYKIVTNGQYYRWVDNTGYMSIWDRDSEEEAADKAWNWIKFLAKGKRDRDSRNWKKVKGFKHVTIKEIKQVTKEEKKELKQTAKKEKEKVKMGLTFGTWVLLFIFIVIVAKTAHYISLKTIFKPTKKVARYVGKEWEES